jgi:biotin carboxyl carrier protein
MAMSGARDDAIDASPEVRAVDPGAVRVSLAPVSAHADLPPVVVERPAGGGTVRIDGRSVETRLDHQGPIHRVLHHDPDGGSTPLLILPADPAGEPPAPGVVRREVIVDGWRVVVDVELEGRASLRERARQGRERTTHDGPTEVRAIIPGRVAAVSVAAGDAVVAGQQLLVVEAMKMQNELRAPRDASVTWIAVGPGQTIEVGDLLLVLE